MKKSSKIIIGILTIIILVGIGSGIYYIVTKNGKSDETEVNIENKVSNSLEEDAMEANDENNNIDTEKKQKDETENDDVLYVYSSGDNAAAHGHPEMLYVYNINENEMNFKYHSGWNEHDIGGIAKSSSGNTYVYEDGTKRIVLELNSMGENSIKVTEYVDGKMLSWKNLFTDSDVNVINNKTEQTTDTTGDTDLLNMEGHYKTEETTNNHYRRVEVDLKNQKENGINFSINAAYGNDVEHVNIGEVSGQATKIDVPEENIVPNGVQVAFKYTDTIDGKANEIIFVCTKYRQFQYVQVIENYATENNPYAGNRVFFEGEHEFIPNN